jgi:hypothetical protein
MNKTCSKDNEKKDKDYEEENAGEGFDQLINQDGKFIGKVGYKMFFMDRRTFFGVITCTYCCFLFQFTASFFVTALEYEKHVPVKYNGER